MKWLGEENLGSEGTCTAPINGCRKGNCPRALQYSSFLSAFFHFSPPTAIMRAQHTAHALPAFPVYSSAFLSSNELILGGGGGASRSGIKNKLVRVHLHPARCVYLIETAFLEIISRRG